MWIKMPKWTIFEVSFPWKHQCFCFHYWDYLTKIWRNNRRSIFDGAEGLSYLVRKLVKVLIHCFGLGPESKILQFIIQNAFFFVSLSHLICEPYSKDWCLYVNLNLPLCQFICPDEMLFPKSAKKIFDTI